jgi:hypothetical protein
MSVQSCMFPFFCHFPVRKINTLSIHEKYRQPGAEVRKGDELGIFQFGGSAIIVAFQEGRIEFDHDMVDMSRRRIHVAVEVGMSLGRAASHSSVSSSSSRTAASRVSPPGDLSYAAVVEKGKVE